jgi:hypothetical protein
MDNGEGKRRLRQPTAALGERELGIGKKTEVKSEQNGRWRELKEANNCGERQTKPSPWKLPWRCYCGGEPDERGKKGRREERILRLEARSKPQASNNPRSET